MKYFLIPILIFLFALPVMADNTHTADLEQTTNEYFNLADAQQTGLDGGSSFSMEAWVNMESLPTASERYGIMNKWDTTGDRSYHFGIFNNAGTYSVRLEVNDTTAGDENKSFTWTTPVVDTWYHLAVTWDGSTKGFRFFLDGVEQGTEQTGTVVDDILDGTTEFSIGPWTESRVANMFDGKIDDYRFWSDVRTPTEISDNYDCQLVGDEAGLEGYWQFNNDATDETANSNDLTENNTPTYQSGSLPFTAECGAGGGGATSTATTTIEASSMPIENDIGVITSYTEIYTDSTTTPSEIRKTYYHIPFFVWLAFALVTFFIMNRVIIELLIRFRK